MYENSFQTDLRMFASLALTEPLDAMYHDSDPSNSQFTPPDADATRTARHKSDLLGHCVQSIIRAQQSDNKLLQ